MTHVPNGRRQRRPIPRLRQLIVRLRPECHDRLLELAADAGITAEQLAERALVQLLDHPRPARTITLVPPDELAELDEVDRAAYGRILSLFASRSPATMLAALWELEAWSERNEFVTDPPRHPAELERRWAFQ
jgi:hypothetical protein